MEKLNQTVGFVYFVMLLDNNGKRIYSRYFVNEGHSLYDASQQKEFEKKIGQTVLNLNVNKNNEGNIVLIQVDVFNLNEFLVVCKINKEIAMFIGAHEDDNECIVANILDIFEECLENITKHNLSKKSIMENYQHLALLIDEMIDEGIVINTDSENLESKVYLRESKTTSTSESGGGYFKSVRLLFII